MRGDIAAGTTNKHPSGSVVDPVILSDKSNILELKFKWIERGVSFLHCIPEKCIGRLGKGLKQAILSVHS